jgi:hypothetical protein
LICHQHHNIFIQFILIICNFLYQVFFCFCSNQNCHFLSLLGFVYVLRIFEQFCQSYNIFSCFLLYINTDISHFHPSGPYFCILIVCFLPDVNIILPTTLLLRSSFSNKTDISHLSHRSFLIHLNLLNYF